MATYRAEKLEALRNIVLNAAAGLDLDDVLRGTFLGYVERFSGFHLRVLKLLSNPRAEPAMVAKAEGFSISGSLSAVLRAAIPETGPDDALLERVISDLDRERLVSGVGLNGMMTGSGLLEKRTTEAGDAFLQFITSPIE